MIPQTEILKHADLFITHCGVNSINESISAQVPMLGIPLMGDQYEGAHKIELCNIGKSLDKSKNNFTQNILKNTILEILKNADFYKENIKKIKEVDPQSFAQIIEEIMQELTL